MLSLAQSTWSRLACKLSPRLGNPSIQGKPQQQERFFQALFGLNNVNVPACDSAYSPEAGPVMRSTSRYAVPLAPLGGATLPTLSSLKRYHAPSATLFPIAV